MKRLTPKNQSQAVFPAAKLCSPGATHYIPLSLSFFSSNMEVTDLSYPVVRIK